MPADGGLNPLIENMLDGRKRGALVKHGQPRIAFNIQRDNWHKPAFILGHGGASFRSSFP